MGVFVEDRATGTEALLIPRNRSGPVAWQKAYNKQQHMYFWGGSS